MHLFYKAVHLSYLCFSCWSDKGYIRLCLSSAVACSLAKEALALILADSSVFMSVFLDQSLCVQAALAAGLLGLTSWKPRFVGFLGVVASAINCYMLFPALPKPAEKPARKEVQLEGLKNAALKAA